MNSMQRMFDAMGSMARVTRAQYHVTLGQMIETLKQYPKDIVIKLSDNPQEYPSANSISYRGYYCDLAFAPTTWKITVGEFLNECERALETIYEGYKGGEYVMDVDTPLWIAHEGVSSGRAITEVKYTDGYVLLNIKQV